MNSAETTYHRSKTVFMHFSILLSLSSRKRREKERDNMDDTNVAARKNTNKCMNTSMNVAPGTPEKRSTE